MKEYVIGRKPVFEGEGRMVGGRMVFHRRGDGAPYEKRSVSATLNQVFGIPMVSWYARLRGEDAKAYSPEAVEG